MTANRVLHPDDFIDAKADAFRQLLQDADPALWSRKYPGALLQYVYAYSVLFDTLFDAAPFAPLHILVAGALEDPMIPALTLGGHNLQPVDPHVNGLTVSQFFASYPYVAGMYRAVIAASVIEHIPDDAAFMEDVLTLLAPGGVFVATTDYKAGWQDGDALAPTEERLYTAESLRALTDRIADRVDFLGERDWTTRGDYFSYAGIDYSFAGIAFRKREA